MKKLLSILIIATLALSSVGCGGSASAPPAAPSGGSSTGAAAPAEPASGGSDSYILKFGTVCNESHPVYPIMQEFKSAVEERSGNRIEVQIYPSGQLGGEREMFESLMMGNLELIYGGSMTLGNFTDKVKFWGLPFFFSGGREACMEFFDTYGQEIQDGVLADTGIHCIWTDNGAFNPANSARALNTPDDMKGLKFRCHEIDTFIKGYEALGATAVPMAFPEIYTALQQGTINGTHTNNLLLESNKFYEVCKYYSPINLNYDMGVTGLSDIFYDSLPEDLKAIVWEECENFRDGFNSAIKEYETGVDERLQDGLVEYKFYTSDELAPFLEKVQSVYDWFESTNTEPNFEKYNNAAKEINAKYLD